MAAANFKPILNMRFGRFVVIEESERGKARRVICKCDCGAIKSVLAIKLRGGDTVSCGCYRSDRLKTHGNSKQREFVAWKDMIRRCTDKKCRAFNHYGGRGVSVCDRWLNSYEAFLEDMGLRPKNGTLDRINNDGNYEPGNCRWATQQQQLNNQKRNRKLEIDGVTKTVSEWARSFGVYPEAALARIAYGWEPVRAVSQPVKSRKGKS